MQLEIFTDGGSRGNPGEAAIGVVVREGDTILYESGKTIGIATNNEAEYQAILHSLFWLESQKQVCATSTITWKLDSKLVVEQLSKRWKIKEPRMLTFAQQAWKLLEKIGLSYKIKHIPREENSHADALVNQALDAAKV
jgi:ribonuclease HI